MKFYIEGPGGLPGAKQAREIRTALPAYFEGNVTVLGTLSAAAESVTSELLTVASANALTVGANGVTNPVFNVDSATASVATGLNIQGLAAGSGVKLTVLSSGTNEDLYLDAKGSGGNIYLAVNGGGGVQMNKATTIQIANPAALSVGRTGQTNPQFSVNTNTASAVTGLTVAGAAAGAGVALNAISSGTNENFTIDAKGSGYIAIGSVSTGSVLIPRLVAASSTSVPAGGSSGASLLMSSLAALGVYFGSGAPTVSAAQGSIYIRTDGSSTSTRLYVNTNGTTGWTNLTSAT